MIKFLLLLFSFFTVTAVAQTKSENHKNKKVNIPAEVKLAFEKEFPGKHAKWETEDGGYEASFELEGKDASALYNSSGHRMELETEVSMKQIPAAAVAYVEKNYAGSKISETAKIVNDKNVVTYEIEVKKDGKKQDVLFDADGKLLNAVK